MANPLTVIRKKYDLELFLLITFCCLSVGIVSILSGLSSFYPGALENGKAIFLLTLCFSFLCPRYTLSALLALLPVFGNRPGSLEIDYLQLIASGVALGVLFKLLLKKETRKNFFSSANNKFIFLSYLYLLCSFLSLSSLPIKKVFLEAWSILPDFNISTLVFASKSLSAPETTLNYSFHSAILTAYAVLIAHLIYCFAKENEFAAKLFSFAIFFGLLNSFLFGLLDYYSIIDLRAWRALDPVVNPGNQQFRLQSFFAHSGWYAEYVTLCIPYALSILALGISYRARVILIVCALVLGELILILTYQRGGWVSYPLTLVVVWTAIYLFRKLETAEVDVLATLKNSFLKVLLSLPLTIILTLVIAKILSSYGLIQDQKVLSRYYDRLQEIAKVDDRSEFIKAGFKIGLLHPILGAGSESFALQYRKEFAKEDGYYYKEFVHPLHGTAHNAYMQTFSGKGLVGLCLLLALSLSFAANCFKSALREKNLNPFKRLILLIGASSSAAFLIYSNVQEVFYVQSLQYLFFASIAIVAGTNDELFNIETKTKKKLLYSLLALFCLHLVWEYSFPGGNRDYLSSSPTYGCYKEQTNSHKRKFRWCSNKAAQYLPVKAGALEFKIYSDGWRNGAKSSKLILSSAKEKLAELDIKAKKLENVKIQIPDKLLGQINEKAELLVEFRLDNYLIPAKDLRTQDFRVLGFQLYR